jgi:hypothetical protein
VLGTLDYCMDARQQASGTICRMSPFDLTELELETAARACRALAHREQESAKAIGDPALRAPVRARAECAAALAEKS